MKSRFTHSVMLVCLCMLCSGSIVWAQTIAPGFGFTLFACANGSVSVSGMNTYGQLGTGDTNIQRRTNMLLTSISGVSAISAGSSHSIFLKNDGTVWACGRNLFGQLGDGTNVNKLVPTKLSSLSNIKAIAAGDNYSMYLKSDGTVWGSGANISGSIGDGTNEGRNTPVQAKGVSEIVAISTGFAHTLFLKNDGTVWACGVNLNGELGLGTQTTMQTTPMQIPSLAGVTAVSASYTHSLFLKKDGTVWTCGLNKFGGLGDNTTDLKTTPVQVPGLTGIKAIAAGPSFSLFLKDDGTVWGCGVNASGELGQGGTVPAKYLVPVQITAVTGSIAIFAGLGDNSFFIKKDNSMWATGYNNTGELGTGNDYTDGKVTAVLNKCSSVTAVETLSENPEIRVYPNPSNGTFRLVMNRIPVGSDLEIYTITGQKENSQIISSSGEELNLTGFSRGIYFYKLANQHHILALGKIIVN